MKSYKQGYADVNGLKMYYEIRGEGQPIVLIHGAGSTIQTTFGRIIDDLAKTRQVIGVELQAHGHTSDRNAEISFQQDADDVAELMRQLNIGKADIFGFSNGGSTALNLAIRHPEQVRKVVCASALLKRNGTAPQFWDFMKNATLDHMPKELRNAFMEINNDSARLLIMHDKCARRMQTMTDMTDEELASIKAPVLLVTGDKDVPTPEHFVQMSGIIPNSQLAILPGGHGEYMGEITTPTVNDKEFTITPILNNFLK
jgi:pimeloyl-ACP methyl ester carboxylesterase